MPAYRAIALLLLASSSSAALAAEDLRFGPPPNWVVPNKVPNSANAPSDAPIAMLLSDQQIALNPGNVAIYTETAVKIQNGQGLAIGNVSFPWDPATNTVTVHKLAIRRGEKTIDVLASGQKFQIIRREGNLELAMLDGRLTANIQPEGLQVGDILELATTIEMADPVLQGHVEAVFANWNSLPFRSARAKLIWPRQVDLKIRKADSLPAVTTSSNGGTKVAEISLENVEPLLTPKGAPLRFAIGRIAEASDYESWSQVADLLIPFYEKASVIPPSGALRDEVERIRKATPDPFKRAELSLDLVQDRVRYVALLMGEGGYVPASAESTWSRRFGDCKAKTALLLALLHEFEIEAAPAAVNSRFGDALTGRLPMLSLFDHVLVRAKINGQTFWLDGTRTGDHSLDKIAVPNFRWVLPLVPNADLVPLIPSPLTSPSIDTIVSIDASSGVFAPSPFKVERILRGDVARELQPALANMTTTQLDQSMREYWRDIYDYVAISSASYSYEKEKGELKLSMKGNAKLDWNEGWYSVPHAALAFEPDLERAVGPDQAAPWTVAYPAYDRARVTITLPPGFGRNAQRSVPPVKETLAGVEYDRTVEFSNDVFSMERSERAVSPEITHAEALAAEPRLKALADEDVYLRVPENYRATDDDLRSKAAEKPSSADAFLARGLIYFDKHKYDEAIADFTEAHQYDPKSVWPLANRGLTQVWKRDFKSAEADLAAAEAIDADNRVLLRGRGLLAEFKGNLNEAQGFYDKALERTPDDYFVRLRRAALRLQQGKREEALADVNAVLASDPRNAGALAQRAYIAVGKEDWKSAEKDIADALAADPQDATVLATKAMIAMYQKDYSTALVSSAEALKRDPNNEYAQYLQAKLLQRESGKDRSMQAFDEAVARTPTDPTALLNRASAYIDAKNFDAAEKDIEGILAAAPMDPRAMMAKGFLASARGNDKAAVEAYTKVLEATPDNGPALIYRADAHRRLGDYDLALADTEAAMKAGSLSPSLRLQRVNILVQKGDFPAAAAETDRLVEENPKSEFALVAAGKAYAAIGDRQKAMATIDKAIAINPVSYIYINRSQVRPRSDLEGKLADLDAALKIDPNHEDAFAEKAHLLSKAGRYQEAIELYDRAIKLALDGRYLQLPRAVALERAGRSAEAKLVFENEGSRAKTAYDFYRLCWNKAVNDILLASALEDCEAARRIEPSDRYANGRGMVLLKMGKLQDASAAYDKAVTTSTAGASAFMGRAIVRARLGNSSGAQVDAEKARKLAPFIDELFEDYGFNTIAELGRSRGQPAR